MATVVEHVQQGRPVLPRAPMRACGQPAISHLRIAFEGTINKQSIQFGRRNLSPQPLPSERSDLNP